MYKIPNRIFVGGIPKTVRIDNLIKFLSLKLRALKKKGDTT